MHRMATQTLKESKRLNFWGGRDPGEQASMTPPRPAARRFEAPTLISEGKGVGRWTARCLTLGFKCGQEERWPFS